jgi:chemotaxis protein methyltransferase WspC
MTSGPWGTIETMLTDWIGLDPGSVGANLIPRAVKLRMLELRVADVQDYAALLARSDSERTALIEEVVVPESWFFRDTAPFALLGQHARDGWLADSTRPPIRVLSMPSAAGEEPYSAVITLREAGLSPARFRVDGVDISARKLEQARRGVYSANAFRNPDGPIIGRYFRTVPGGFELHPEIRDRVRFFRASVLDPALLEGEPRYDVLFCRNLLIYLNEPARARVMATIDRLLAADGLLIIGHADRLGRTQQEPAFTPVGDRATFAYRRAAFASAPARLAALPGPATPPKELPPPPRRAGVPPPQGDSPRPPPSAATGRPATTPASAKPNPVSPPPAAGGGSLLERAAILANDGRRQEAISACQESIRREGPTGEAYFLMGMIHSSLGNHARAEESFSRAIYLDPAHDEALLALALCAERRGDAAAAAAFRRRAGRAAIRKGTS